MVQRVLVLTCDAWGVISIVISRPCESQRGLSVARALGVSVSVSLLAEVLALRDGNANLPLVCV